MAENNDNPTRFKCESCGAEFKTNTTLLLHQKNCAAGKKREDPISKNDKMPASGITKTADFKPAQKKPNIIPPGSGSGSRLKIIFVSIGAIILIIISLMAVYSNRIYLYYYSKEVKKNMEVKNYTEALSTYKKILEIDASNIEAKKGVAECEKYNNLAEASKKTVSNDFDGAIKVYKAVLAKEPQNTEAKNGIANCESLKVKYEAQKKSEFASNYIKFVMEHKLWKDIIKDSKALDDMYLDILLKISSKSEDVDKLNEEFKKFGEKRNSKCWQIIYDFKFKNIGNKNMYSDKEFAEKIMELIKKEIK